jgi:hypothetical protein
MDMTDIQVSREAQIQGMPSRLAQAKTWDFVPIQIVTKAKSADGVT